MSSMRQTFITHMLSKVLVFHVLASPKNQGMIHGREKAPLEATTTNMAYLVVTPTISGLFYS